MGRKLARRAEEDTISGWANVVALDPGGSTGWSVFMVHPDALAEPDLSVLTNVEHWAHGEVYGDEDEQAVELMELFASWPDAALVSESFKIRQMSVELSPVRVLAKVEFGLKFWPGLTSLKRNVHLQTPALAKTTCTDDRLRNWGFYEKDGSMPHARDADRHALTFLRRAKQHPGLRKLAWPELYGEAT